MVRTLRHRALGLLGLLVLGLAGCAPGQASGTAGTSDAGAVVEAFLAARAQRDLDATMASFDPVPELRSGRGINWPGRDAVRAIMAYRIMDTYTVGERHVSGDTVSWSEHVRRTVAAGGPPTTFDEDVTATVSGGHIKILVTSLGGPRVEPTVDVPAQPASRPVTPLLLPLSLALLILAVLVWPWGAGTAPRRVPSGHLLVGLQRYAEMHAVQSRQERH